MKNPKSDESQPDNANKRIAPDSPTPLPLLTPVKNSPSLSPPVEDRPETLDIRRFFHFEKKVHRILKDFSGCFKLLQVEINHLDRNDFLADHLKSAMGKVSNTIHQMEQLCVDKNPEFIPAKDPGPSENTLSETQAKAEQEASDEFFIPKPEPPISVRKTKRKEEQIILEVVRESIPSPQLRNIPSEFLDFTQVRFFSKETDASKPENKMSPRMKSYMAEIKRIYDAKDERDRKAAEARSQAQSNPPTQTQPNAIQGTPSNN